MIYYDDMPVNWGMEEQITVKELEMYKYFHHEKNS